MTARIIISLTNRRPISIDPDEWPILAEVMGTDYFLSVRQRKNDKRAIVYGNHILPSKIDVRPHNRAGGELLKPRPSEDQLMRTIREVGTYLELPEEIIRRCFDSLEPEEI